MPEDVQKLSVGEFDKCKIHIYLYSFYIMLFNIFQAYFNILKVILWVWHVKETLWITCYKIGNFALYISDLCCMFQVLIPKEEFQNWKYRYQACWKSIVEEIQCRFGHPIGTTTSALILFAHQYENGHNWSIRCRNQVIQKPKFIYIFRATTFMKRPKSVKIIYITKILVQSGWRDMLPNLIREIFSTTLISYSLAWVTPLGLGLFQNKREDTCKQGTLDSFSINFSDSAAT